MGHWEKHLTAEQVQEMSTKDLHTLPAVQESFAYRRTSHRAYGEKLHLHTYAVVAVGLEKLVWKKIENTN